MYVKSKQSTLYLRIVHIYTLMRQKGDLSFGSGCNYPASSILLYSGNAYNHHELLTATVTVQ
jgi:hypothetical protein